MNEVDVALAVLLLLFAVRGFVRGFFRELFGFAAILAGVAASLLYTERVALEIAPFVALADQLRHAVAFVGIFVVVHSVLNLIGFVLERLTFNIVLRTASRLGGAGFGAAKGAAILAFVLLFLHLFPVDENLDRKLMNSEVARNLSAVAGAVLKGGWRDAVGGGQKQA